MNFCVVGGGAWGTAFALHLARLGHGGALAPRRAEHAAAVAAVRENRDYLPGFPLPPGLKVTSDLEEGFAAASVVLVACPAQALRDTAGRIQTALARTGTQPFVVSLSKGLETGTHLRPSQVLASVLPGLRVGALTGPSNAAEVARGLPAAMVLAAENPDQGAGDIQAAASSATLRIYTSDDLAGVEFGGALKNTYAIAAGCCDGLRLGDNAKAALLTRALPEMVRVGEALGARPETFYGLSGFGDLAATCYASWSRNREFGQLIAEGHPVARILANRRTVVEGYRTTESFAGLCLERGIDAPILREMHGILFSGRRPAEALAALMARGLKRESAASYPATAAL
jgi:glycerol-3-phosphate dehydrogenase (NAD(P)+)